MNEVARREAGGLRQASRAADVRFAKQKSLA